MQMSFPVILKRKQIPFCNGRWISWKGKKIANIKIFSQQGVWANTKEIVVVK